MTMRRGFYVFALAAALAVAGWPERAYADGFFSPWVGSNFANEPGDGRGSFGFTAGSLGRGVVAVGGEFDFGYSPNFFGASSLFGNNNVLSAMGNVIVGVPFGGRRGLGIRPYVTGGIGLIRSVVEGPANILDVQNNDPGFNLGFGVMGFLSDHVGVRGDLRFMRTFSTDDTTPNPLDFNLSTFDFWRGSVGIVLR
jgi:Outer membrane protein beta-barrel domain